MERCLGVEIPAELTTAQEMVDKWERQQNIERNLRRRLTINQIADVLTEAKVYDSVAKRAALAGDILDGNVDILKNAFGTNVNKEVQGLVHEYRKLWDNVYFFANAPIASEGISFEKDQIARDYQIQNFKKIFIGTSTKKQAHTEEKCDVNSYDELYRKTETFVETMAISSCASSFFFNGHGSENGMHFSEDNDPIPLHRYINDLYELASKCGLKNVRLIFAQCHGHLYTCAQGVLTYDFIVTPLSSPEKPSTFYIVKHDDTSTGCQDKQISDSKHLCLNEFAEKRNKEHRRESEVLPRPEFKISKFNACNQNNEPNNDTNMSTAQASFDSLRIHDDERFPVAETRGNSHSLPFNQHVQTEEPESFPYSSGIQESTPGDIGERSRYMPFLGGNMTEQNGNKTGQGSSKRMRVTKQQLSDTGTLVPLILKTDLQDGRKQEPKPELNPRILNTRRRTFVNQKDTGISGNNAEAHASVASYMRIHVCCYTILVSFIVLLIFMLILR